MTTDRDALDVLAASDPARSLPVFDPTSPRGREVLRRAKAMPSSVSPAPDAGPRRGPRLIAVAAIGMAALAAAAAAYVNTRQPDRVLTVACVAPADAGDRTFVVSTQEDDAVDACWAVWRSGKFSPVPTPSRLVACVVDDGSVGVYPGGPDTCARLRRDPAPTGVRAAPALVRLSDELAKAQRSDSCLLPAAARAQGRAALDAAGLPHWPVTEGAEGFSQAKPCAGFLIDEAQDRLVLVPQPRPAGG